MSMPVTTSLACEPRHGTAPMPYRCQHLLIAICLLSSGCGRTINRAAERRIRDTLPQYIGHARVWRAHVENPPERTLRGKLSQITIDGEGVDFGETIRLAQLHI